ncbi:AbrB/MazE/SpoVT family DNA-binding domain-containing protein [Candidatus Bathyarchaeota archaeon]|nr:AbrB/MazE/SpoVT family DNA-binding domain-containing protein [Candidatus Bathyarchaeota archaeon]MBS7628862.1 AbrB/MazE/SpoVT family DNA-binding domain-containing protein [Candidatus Bathyarchaeota archaeon]
MIEIDTQIKVPQKGKITIPSKIKERLGINEDDYLRMEIVGNRLILLPPKTAPNPTELLSGLAEGNPIKKPVKEELREAVAAKAGEKLSRTIE